MGILKEPPQPITKTFMFSVEELRDLKEIEVAAITFRRAIAGMEVNREFVLQESYKRMGIEQESPKKDWLRHISYNLAKNEIKVVDAPKAEESKEIKTNGQKQSVEEK